MKAVIAMYWVTVLLVTVFYWRNWLPAFALFQVGVFFILYSTLCPNCQLFGPVITRFNTNKMEVWLTIDDGPHPEDTLRLIELLNRFNARATFFVIGKNAERYPEIITALRRSGHRIGNHSHSHPSATFWCLLPSGVACQIDRCAQTLFRLTGKSPRLFRAPVGMANYFVHAAIRKRKLWLIGWSVRGFDGVNRCTENVAQRILQSVRPGSIILLHEGRRDQQNRPINLIIIEMILTRLQQEGYTFIIPPEEQWVTH